MQSISIDRLFGHRAPNITAEETFERAVGWRYGFMFGVATVVTGWGYDGWEQLSAPVDLAGVKFLLAAIAILPILFSRVRWRRAPAILFAADW